MMEVAAEPLRGTDLVKVYAEATVVFPMIVAATFARRETPTAAY